MSLSKQQLTCICSISQESLADAEVQKTMIGLLPGEVVGWGGMTSCGLHLTMKFQLMLRGEKCNIHTVFYMVKEYKGLRTVL